MKTGLVLVMFFSMICLSACSDDASVVADYSSSATSTSSAATAVVFSGLIANGASNVATTTALTLIFNADPATLTAGDITVAGATKGAMTGSGVIRTLAISDITVANGDTVSVAVASPAGFSISGSPMTVAVYKTLVAFSGLTANGTAGSVTTTELTLTFSIDPATLAASDITVTGATKGALGGSGTTRKLAISAITVTNGADVTVTLANPSGFIMTPASKIVAVNVCPLDSVTYRDMVTVPGGTFSQVPTSGNTFSHAITGFWMGKYEVTYELWYAVFTWATANGYVFANAGKEGSAGTVGAAPTAAKFEPVSMVNWRDAIVWCNAYSRLAGLTPVYCSDSGFTMPVKDSSDGSYGSSLDMTAGSFDNPHVNPGATGYRLPTEGQWQYAASYQDGSSWTLYTWASGATAKYDDAAATGSVAWYNGNSGGATQAVGTKTANLRGICDMSGNVWEWCWDWSGTLPPVAQTNYSQTVPGSSRVNRGGGCGSSVLYMQVGIRYENLPYFEHSYSGFRVSLP